LLQDDGADFIADRGKAVAGGDKRRAMLIALSILVLHRLGYVRLFKPLKPFKP
jgi:hypothetical protein